jgi:hypothetical protein
MWKRERLRLQPKREKTDLPLGDAENDGHSSPVPHVPEPY